MKGQRHVKARRHGSRCCAGGVGTSEKPLDDYGLAIVGDRFH
jgi:hypothetical protein